MIYYNQCYFTFPDFHLAGLLKQEVAEITHNVPMGVEAGPRVWSQHPLCCSLIIQYTLGQAARDQQHARMEEHTYSCKLKRGVIAMPMSPQNRSTHKRETLLNIESCFLAGTDAHIRDTHADADVSHHHSEDLEIQTPPTPTPPGQSTTQGEKRGRITGRVLSIMEDLVLCYTNSLGSMSAGVTDFVYVHVHVCKKLWDFQWCRALKCP